ncbi:MAG TPA: VWA domain-containing protein [Thermoanaerobaculia bacterium]|jgi:hypothetical protein
MSGELPGNILLFGRVLRGLGLDAGTARMLDVVAALDHVSIGEKADFYHAARSLTTRRREDLPVFDRAFEAFWRKPAHGRTTRDLAALGEKRRMRPPTFDPAPPAPDVEDVPGTGTAETPVFSARVGGSAREILRRKDFAELTAEELERVRALIRGLAWRVADRSTRRRRPGDGEELDLRRTLRTSLRHGGEVLAWERRERRRRPRRIVALADVSGSMERYTRLLLLFLHALSRGLGGRVEVFLFGTRLTRVTRALASRDPDAALAAASAAVPDWSGGTRIGEALRDFNFRWARRVLGGGAVVLVVSDGWDRGDPDLLAREAARLQRSAHRLVWLNPLLGAADYRPLARGIRAALPSVDDFLPVHNLASLEDLARRLERIPADRPRRRQHREAR